MDVVFDKEKHRYRAGDREFESVTSYVNRHKTMTSESFIGKKFKMNMENVSTALEDKNSEASKLLQSWKEKSIEAKRKGTLIHDMINEAIKNKVDSHEDPKVNMVLKWIKDNGYEVLGTEQSICDIKTGLAGTYDAILMKDGEPILVDWKTGKDIQMTNDVKMQKPYSKYDDCTFIHYSLQLSLYKKILKSYKIRIGRCLIVHIGDKLNVYEALEI